MIIWELSLFSDTKFIKETWLSSSSFNFLRHFKINYELKFGSNRTCKNEPCNKSNKYYLKDHKRFKDSSSCDIGGLSQRVVSLFQKHTISQIAFRLTIESYWHRFIDVYM